jgi:hypothetical protein
MPCRLDAVDVALRESTRLVRESRSFRDCAVPAQESCSSPSYCWFYLDTKVAICVEINQCVGCTRQFFTKSFLSDDAAVLARSSGEEHERAVNHAGGYFLSFLLPYRYCGLAAVAWSVFWFAPVQ